MRNIMFVVLGLLIASPAWSFSEKDLEEVDKLFENDPFIKLYSNNISDLIG